MGPRFRHLQLGVSLAVSVALSWSWPCGRWSFFFPSKACASLPCGPVNLLVKWFQLQTVPSSTSTTVPQSLSAAERSEAESTERGRRWPPISRSTPALASRRWGSAPTRPAPASSATRSPPPSRSSLPPDTLPDPSSSSTPDFAVPSSFCSEACSACVLRCCLSQSLD